MKDLKELARMVDKYSKQFESEFNYDQHMAIHKIWLDIVLSDNPKVFDEPFNSEIFDRNYKHVTYSPLNK